MMRGKGTDGIVRRGERKLKQTGGRRRWRESGDSSRVDGVDDVDVRLRVRMAVVALSQAGSHLQPWSHIPAEERPRRLLRGDVGPCDGDPGVGRMRRRLHSRRDVAGIDALIRSQSSFLGPPAATARQCASEG